VSRLVRSLSACAILGALFGCGGLANPDGSLATVSGSLKGAAAPAGAHVALVWRSPKGAFVVTNDTPVTNGTFSFDLNGPPDDSLFSQLDTSGSSAQPGSSSASGGSSGSGTAPAPPSTGSSGAASYGMHFLDTVSGTVSSPLSFAVAGFVVYADKNGNGQLDLTGSNADSPDQILGGSSELVLTYLRDGSDLELEKLRDSAGQKPSRGYQLAWIPKGRWLPLSSVDLTIGVSSLPNDICGGSSSSTTFDVSGDAGAGTPDDAGIEPSPPGPVDGGVDVDASTDVDGGASGGSGGSGYPSAADPSVVCSPDGRSFSYTCPTRGNTTDAGASSSTSRGLCGASYDVAPPEPVTCYPGASLADGQPAPAGWPCIIGTPVDGGPAPDSGPMDGGAAPDAG
jgi:hypothetical protein